ncbi:MAG: Ig-like domain-containing protein [Bacteroidales bacterium]|nr:Ig-like domain-containing protein [Bacteroidales bacterium]
MNRRIFKETLPELAVAVLFIISGCAKVSSPSGGPRDKEPPVILKSEPLPGTKNFREKEIVVTFNEFIVLDNINEKFMMSPPAKTKPRIFIRGKSLHVQFQDELKDSTTYTLYFQDAIRDLNEGNPIDNYQHVFSTGPVIDSLSVTGNVYNAFNLEVPENTLVLLYKNLADTSVKKQLPDYITRVEKNGEFRIDNVSGGKYRLYALKDADNSKNFNLPNEAFAFSGEPVIISPDKNYLPKIRDSVVVKSGEQAKAEKPPVEGEYKLFLFEPEKKQRYLTSSGRKMPYQLLYTLSLPPDSMKFKLFIPDAPAGSYFIEKNVTKDTITVWLTDSTLYSKPQIETIVTFPFTDTLGTDTYKTDTIMMRYLAPRAPRVKVRRNTYKFSTGITGGSYAPVKLILFRSETPFRQPDTSRILLYEILKEERKRIPYTIYRDTANSCLCVMTADLQQGNSYLFIADSAAFGNIYGENNDSTAIRFNVRLPDSYGKLTITTENYQGRAVIQLLGSDEKLVRETLMKEPGVIEFPFLEKGLYRLKVIYDLNGDGKWTTGDFSAGRQPEPVSYYPSELDVKANWEINQKWDIGKMYYKEQKLRRAQKTTR